MLASYSHVCYSGCSASAVRDAGADRYNLTRLMEVPIVVAARIRYLVLVAKRGLMGATMVMTMVGLGELRCSAGRRDEPRPFHWSGKCTGSLASHDGADAHTVHERTRAELSDGAMVRETHTTSIRERVCEVMG